MLNEPGNRPNIRPGTPPTQQWIPPRPIAPPPPTASTHLQPPGCVLVTIAVFLMMGGISALALLGNMVLLDPLGVIDSLGRGALFAVASLGLWQMTRWGANLVIIFCAGTILQLVILPIGMAFLLDRYIDNVGMRTFFIAVSCGFYLIPIGLLGLVAHWYVRTRKWFLPGNLPARIENWLYVLAITITLISLVISLANLPEGMELQRSSFNTLNRY